jgi:hypothetical protein
VPSDSRLPDGGGYQLTGMTLNAAGAATSQSNFVTLAKNYGEQTEHFNGVNISVTSRLQNGLLLQGGMGTGRVVTDDCEIVDQLPETLHQFLGANTRTFVFAARPRENCHQNNGFRTQFQGLAAYTVPKIDVQFSGTFQNLPGGVVSANYNMPSSATDLGRPFLGAPFQAMNIVRPGDLYIERLNQIDLRVSKIFRFSSTRTALNFDFYNVGNGNSVIAENFTYAPAPSTAWRTPQTILLARMFKISADFEF